jgi:hypothetical protein
MLTPRDITALKHEIAQCERETGRERVWWEDVKATHANRMMRLEMVLAEKLALLDTVEPRKVEAVQDEPEKPKRGRPKKDATA